MRALLVALGILLVPAAALPCDRVVPAEWEIDPAEAAIDDQPPSPAALAKLVVIRGVRPLFDAGLRDSCDAGDGRDGEVRVYLDLATDDRTETWDIGYRIDLAGRHLPPGYRPGSWIAPNGNWIFLRWQERDDDDPLDFTLRLTPLDRAGNEGPTLVVPVRDDGIGCSSAGGDAGALPLAVAVLALAAARRRP